MVLRKCKKQAEEDGQVFRAHLNEYGEIYYTSGEPNLDILAKFLYEEMKKKEGTLKIKRVMPMGKIKNVPKLKEITFEERKATPEEIAEAKENLEEVLANMFLYYYKFKRDNKNP